MAITPEDLAIYLDLTEVSEGRALMLIGQAVDQALSLATVGDVPESGATEENLPPGAESVILPAVARIYLNPAGVTQESTPGFSVARSTATGSLFSKAEKRTLRRLAGRGGAFSIDMLPEGAGENLPPWDIDGGWQ